MRDLFRALVRTVIAQQISTEAADTISSRLESAVGSTLSPESVLALSSEAIRECGLSSAKQRTVRAIADRIVAGELNLARLRRANDEAIEETLLGIPGIGPWSLHMIQIFALGRLNVLPTGDLGLRLAVRDQFGLAEAPTADEVQVLAESWHPYCTVATWYLWRSRGFVPNST